MTKKWVAGSVSQQRSDELRKLTAQRSLGLLEHSLPFVTADQKFSKNPLAQSSQAQKKSMVYAETDSEFLRIMANQIPPRSVITEIRQSLGLTQQDCARISLISTRQWQRIESGRSTATLPVWHLFLVNVGLVQPKLPVQVQLKVEKNRKKALLGFSKPTMFKINHG